MSGAVVPALFASASVAFVGVGFGSWAKGAEHVLGSRVTETLASSPERRPAPGPWRRGQSRRHRRRRLAEIQRQVPALLDLLAAGSSAGLSAELSLRRGVEAIGGPLSEDLVALFGQADLGARWREDLAAYARAVGSTDLRRTVAVLERTESIGSSLIDATRDLAASVRSARRAAVLEKARTAPVKMLFPLVFLILPAFLLLTVVPVLLTTLRSIS
jgi:tight adherence protein C